MTFGDIQTRGVPPAEAPGTNQNLLAWWRADSLVDGATWTDLINGYVLDATAHSTPSFNASDANFNGHESLTFDGLTDAYENPLLNALVRNSALTWFVAGKRRVSGSFHVLVSIGDSATDVDNFAYYDIGSGDFLRYRDGADAKDGGVDVGTDPFLACLRLEGVAGGDVELRHNGAQDGAPAVATPDVLTDGDRFGVGALLRNGSTFHFDGEIAEVALFDVALNAPSLSAYESYAKNRYNLF